MKVYLINVGKQFNIKGYIFLVDPNKIIRFDDRASHVTWDLKTLLSKETKYTIDKFQESPFQYHEDTKILNIDEKRSYNEVEVIEINDSWLECFTHKSYDLIKHILLQYPILFV